MPIFETLALLVVIAIGWYWFDSVKVRDIVVAAARAECQSVRHQFLDDSVVLDKIRLMRDEDGRVRLGRTYFFEFSESGSDRRRGSVVMLGEQVVVVSVGLYLLH